MNMWDGLGNRRFYLSQLKVDGETVGKEGV